MLCSCLVITIYVIYVLVAHKKIPESISSTYYNSNKKPWFTIAIILSTLLMIGPLFEMSDDNLDWMVFLSCGGNLMCAVAPNFEEPIENRIHFTGAFLAGILSQLWCQYYHNDTIIYWLIFVLLFIGMHLCRKSFKINYNGDFSVAFWAELLCFVNIYFVYFYYL